MNIVYMSYRIHKYYINMFICLQQQFQKIKHLKFSVSISDLPFLQYKEHLRSGRRTNNGHDLELRSFWLNIRKTKFIGTPTKHWSRLSREAAQSLSPEVFQIHLAEALSPGLNSALTLLLAGGWTRDFSQGPFQPEWFYHLLQAQSAPKFKQINICFPSSPLPTKSYQKMQYSSLMTIFTAVQHDRNQINNQQMKCTEEYQHHILKGKLKYFHGLKFSL